MRAGHGRLETLLFRTLPATPSRKGLVVIRALDFNDNPENRISSLGNKLDGSQGLMWEWRGGGGLEKLGGAGEARVVLAALLTRMVLFLK